MFCEREVSALDSADWDLKSYPYPKPKDERPMVVATERMLWKRDGSLAAAVGKEYPAEAGPLLTTEAEWLSRDHTPASLRPSKPRKGQK
jgi:hypothetical protein